MTKFRLLFSLLILAAPQLAGGGDEIQHPTGAYATVNGAQLWYETEGEGEPLLLIYGGPGSSHLNFHPYFSALADRYRVIYVDLFGRGKSGRAKSPKEYSFRRDVEDIEGLRKFLGLEKMHVLGFSYGSLVAQAYALEHPGAVDKLILLSALHSGAMWQAKNDNYAYEARNLFPETWAKIERLRARGFRGSSKEIREVNDIPALELLFFYNPANAARLRRDAVSANSEILPALGGDDADYRLGGEVAKLDFRKRLGEIRSPMLVIAGRYDRVFPPRQSETFKTYAPKARFVMFEKSGHYPHIEESEKLFALLREFLNE